MVVEFEVLLLVPFINLSLDKVGHLTTHRPDPPIWHWQNFGTWEVAPQYMNSSPETSY